MNFTPTQSLVDANFRQIELTEAHKKLTERINTSEKFLEDTEVSIREAEEAYGAALTQEVINNTKKHKAATRTAKQNIESLKEQYSETRDTLEAARLVRETITNDLRQATNTARRELKEYLRSHAPTYKIAAHNLINEALPKFIISHHLVNGMTSTPEPELEIMLNEHVRRKAPRDVAKEIMDTLSSAVTTDQITVGD